SQDPRRGELEGIRRVLYREQTNYPLLTAVDDNGAGGFGLVVDAVEPADPQAVAAMLHTAVHGLVMALEDALDGGQQTPLCAVGVLDPAGQHRLLVEWNDTAARTPPAAVPEAIAGQVARAPDAVAVTSAGESVSYAELDARAGRLARYLAGLGAGRDSVVGLCLPRGTDMIVALLAVWQSGAAYLPIDPGLPAGRIAFMLADARAAVLLGTGEVLDELPAGPVRSVALDDPRVVVAISAMPGSGPRVPVLAGQLAYVIYTSGSTGTPKGVAVTHGGLASYVASVPSRVGLGGPGRFAVLQDQVTDLGNTVVFGTLAAGGTLLVAPEPAVTDPEAMARFIA